MRKIILGLAATAAIAAPLVAMAGPANADVARQCEDVVVTPATTVTTVTSATFTAIQPANEYHQWANVWTHDFTVTVQPDGKFTGEGVQNGHDVQTTLVNEKVTIAGQFTDSDDTDAVFDHVSYTETRPGDGVSISLTNAPMGTGDIVEAVVAVNGKVIQTPEAVEFKVSAGQFTSSTTTVEALTTNYANHGHYVAAMGGGKAAAQSCVGMPIKSNKVK